MSDEFYIGYQPHAPPLLAARTRGFVVILLLASAALAAVLVNAQRPFAPSTYEFLQVREFTGQLREGPTPSLLVQRPGSRQTSRYLLVGEGKLGAGPAVAGLHLETVRLRGTLIYRDDQTMIEVVSGSVEVLAGSPMNILPVREIDLGMHTLRGEIVDSKCFLGVMNPGNLKVHRACATRCISGGIPPVLHVRGPGGTLAYLLLVGADGRMVNRDVLGMIAEPVEITGRIVRLDDLLVMEADPASYRRLEDG